MPKPQDPTKAPRLRWSPEEIDRLVREAAMLMLAAERNGKALTKNKAVALAQYVLPKDRQREIGADYNPSWMASEGRIEAMIEKLRSELPPAPEAAAAVEPSAAPAPAPAATPEPAAAPVASGKTAAKKAAKPAKLREQAGLFPEPSHGRPRRVNKDVPAEAAVQPVAAPAEPEVQAAPVPAPAPALEVAASAPSVAQVPAPAPVQEPAFETPASEPAADVASEAAERSGRDEAQPPAEPAAEQEEAAPAPAVQTAGLSESEPQEDATPVIVNALATLGVDALAGALRTVASKALAGLLVDVLRQPEVQAALRDALGGGPPRKKPFGERIAAEAETRAPWSKPQREPREARDPAPRSFESRPAAAPRPPVVQTPEDNPQGGDVPMARERDADTDVEPVLFDPNAWQSTPLHALPERTARGASEPPKPRVVMFGLLPKDQQRLKAEFGQKYKLRFGSGANIQHAMDIAKDVDKVYAMVRFIPKELDRGLTESGVPYSPMTSLGELRQELTINPPLTRGELI